jgi:hypothetical protein
VRNVLIQIVYTGGTVVRWSMKLRTAFSVRERMKSSIGISFTSRFFKSACLPNFDEQSYPQSKMRTRAIRVAFIVVGFALLSISPACGEPENISSVKLNPTALTYAKELISGGHVVLDRKSAWAKDKPSTELENEFIRQRGFGEYAKWHLGIDGRYPDNTKRRYKFPYGDFKNVHRCGVLAVQSRAAEYRYSEIENAAAQLREKLEATRNATR